MAENMFEISCLFFEPTGRFEPEKVIYNNPATIVIWKDGTKTVVKKQDSDPVYDPEKGLAICFMKKALGNTSRKLNDQLHKWEQKNFDDHGNLV